MSEDAAGEQDQPRRQSNRVRAGISGAVARSQRAQARKQKRKPEGEQK